MLPASTASPNRKASPDDGGSSPVSIFIVVVLPQPFDPRNPKISPRAISKSTLSTAVKSPNLRVSPFATMAASPDVTLRRGMMLAVSATRSLPGTSATYASSRLSLPVLRINSPGLPVPMTRPSFMAISQSNWPASSM